MKTWSVWTWSEGFSQETFVTFEKNIWNTISLLWHRKEKVEISRLEYAQWLCNHQSKTSKMSGYWEEAFKSHWGVDWAALTSRHAELQLSFFCKEYNGHWYQQVTFLRLTRFQEAQSPGVGIGSSWRYPSFLHFPTFLRSVEQGQPHKRKLCF